ncbi:hypothetical protein EJ08DRAFT_203671 [Tothia fuscella]|uniref:Uncharacterized protein n=1 Tax=Tothia fuscella TaxID=1048955 RepID=A0A9P4NRS0_9PEZI|nr:hypothetical protein EJ08DRAFT_203671 [Tothia fuscella]
MKLLSSELYNWTSGLESGHSTSRNCIPDQPENPAVQFPPIYTLKNSRPRQMSEPKRGNYKTYFRTLKPVKPTLLAAFGWLRNPPFVEYQPCAAGFMELPQSYSRLLSRTFMRGAIQHKDHDLR